LLIGGALLVKTLSEIAYTKTVDATLDALASHLEAHLDCDAMLDAAR
jgi:hypothetical protein